MILIQKPSSRLVGVLHMLVVVTAACLFLTLSGCWKRDKYYIVQSECWNPKILRAQVGTAIFDLPKGVSFHPLDERTAAGVLSVSFEGRNGDVTIRGDCQDKAHVPVDYGDKVGFVLEQELDVNGHMSGEIRPYDPKSADKRQSFYLADISDAKKIKFMGFTTTYWHHKNPKMEIGRRLVFGFNGRRFEMNCSVWGKWTPAEDNWVPGTTFSYSCVPEIPLRMNNIIVAVGDPGKLIKTGAGKPRKAPPEQWPQQWHDTIQKLAGYRIDQTRKASE